MEVNTELCRFCRRDIPDYSILTHEAHCERGHRVKNGFPLLSPEPRSPSPVVEEPSESSVITSPDDVEVATLDNITWNKKQNYHNDTDDESIPDYCQQSTMKIKPGQNITYIPIRLAEESYSENWTPSWNIRSNTKPGDNPDRTLTNSPIQTYTNEPAKHNFDFINSSKIRTPSPKSVFNVDNFDNPSYKSSEPKKQIIQTSVLRPDYDFDYISKPSTSYKNEPSTSLLNGDMSSPKDGLQDGFWETVPKYLTEPSSSKNNNSIFDPGTSTDKPKSKRSSPILSDFVKPGTSHDYLTSDGNNDETPSRLIPDKLPLSSYFGSTVEEKRKSPSIDLSKSDISDTSPRSTIIPITIEERDNKLPIFDHAGKDRAPTSIFGSSIEEQNNGIDHKGTGIFGSSSEEDKKKQQPGVTCPDCHRLQKAGGLRQHLEQECQLRHIDCSFCGIAYLARDLECHMVICGTRSEKCPECEEMIMIKYKHIHLESNHGFIKLDDEPENLTSWIPLPRLPLRPPDILRSVPLSTKDDEARVPIPCEFCDENFPAFRLTVHQLGCRLKQQTSAKNAQSNQSRTAPTSPDIITHSIFPTTPPKSQYTPASSSSYTASPTSTSNKTTYDYPRHISSPPPVAPLRKHKVVHIPTVLQHAKTEPVLSPTSRRKEVEVINFGNVLEVSDRFKDNWKDFERRIKDNNKDDKHVVIPCEYCSKMLKIGEVMSHQMMCFLQH